MTGVEPVDGVAVAVGAVVVDGDRLLLVRRGRPPGEGLWSVPGGRVRRGETLHEAVVREVAEETGLEVVVDRFLGWVERIDLDTDPDAGAGAQHHFVILDFAATPLDRNAEPVAGDDAADVRWCPIDDLGAVALVEGLADFLVEVEVIPATRTLEL